jgi:hypothetical protein
LKNPAAFGWVIGRHRQRNRFCEMVCYTLISVGRADFGVGFNP